MGLSIQNNLAATTVHHHLSASTRSVDEHAARLSSGLRIRTAADDAGGLGIANRMRAHERSTIAATRNVQDARSLLEVADSSLAQMISSVTSMRAIVLHVLNGTLTEADRGVLVDEFRAHASEIRRLVDAAEFNGRGVFSHGRVVVQAGSESDDRIEVELPTELHALFLGLDLTLGSTGADPRLLDEIDRAQSYLSNWRGSMGAAQNRLEGIQRLLLNERENLGSAVSRIRDVDVASEVSAYARARTLQDAGAVVAATANLVPATALLLIARMGVSAPG